MEEEIKDAEKKKAIGQIKRLLKISAEKKKLGKEEKTLKEELAAYADEKGLEDLGDYEFVRKPSAPVLKALSEDDKASDLEKKLREELSYEFSNVSIDKLAIWKRRDEAVVKKALAKHGLEITRGSSFSVKHA